MNDYPYDPAQIPAPASYHWTPRFQREFLEAFATNGSVKISAAKVGISPSAVHQPKQPPDRAAFRLGCAATPLIASARSPHQPRESAQNRARIARHRLKP